MIFFAAAALYLRWFFQWLVLRKPAFSWKNHTVLVGVPGSFEVFFYSRGHAADQMDLDPAVLDDMFFFLSCCFDLNNKLEF